MLQILLILLLLLGSGDVVALTVILLPWRHTSSCADFSPLLLQLGLARYTCGGKRILLGHGGGGSAELEGRRGGNDRCGRLTGVRTGGKVKAGRRMRRERERFVAAVIVIVVVVIVAAGAELEGRRGRLTAIHRRARSKLKHLLGLWLITRWRRHGRSTERTPTGNSPESRRCRSKCRCR